MSEGIKEFLGMLKFAENGGIKKIPRTPKNHGGTPLWALTDSNRRPSACKADALNQLS